MLARKVDARFVENALWGVRVCLFGHAYDDDARLQHSNLHTEGGCGGTAGARGKDHDSLFNKKTNKVKKKEDKLKKEDQKTKKDTKSSSSDSNSVDSPAQ